MMATFIAGSADERSDEFPRRAIIFLSRSASNNDVVILDDCGNRMVATKPEGELGLIIMHNPSSLDRDSNADKTRVLFDRERQPGSTADRCGDMKFVDDEFNRRHILQGIAACCTVLAADSLADEASRHRPFSAVSTAEEVTAGLDLTGKTALVTGCNSGIGYETMRVLALRGAHVIGTARTVENGRSACATVQGRATPVALELTDFDSVARCAREVRAIGTPIDMLILNAGIILERLEQVNGLEKQFVVNHLGHFLLTVLLIDAIKAARQGRVVVVGSGNHRDAPKGGIQFDDLSGRGWSDRAYSHSKLANGLFSLELASRLRGTHATSNCVSPGHTRTNIMRNVSGTYRSNAKTIAQGAATTCYVATQPSLATVSGKYFADCVLTEPSAVQTDVAMAARLWDVSETLTARWLESR